MTRKALVLGVLLLVLGGVGLALASEVQETKDVKLEGWVVCACCGEKNANAEGKGCVMSCQKTGADLVFFSEGKTYKLASQATAKDQVGQQVWAVGQLRGETLTVTQYIATDKKS